MSLPATYEGREARERVERGLRREGIGERCAAWAAHRALAEAPFAAPDDDGWRRTCNRAREVARSAAAEREPQP